MYRLAQAQPAVRAALTLYERGDLSLKHALMTMVLVLAGRLDDTTAALQAQLQQAAPRGFYARARIVKLDRDSS